MACLLYGLAVHVAIAGNDFLSERLDGAKRGLQGLQEVKAFSSDAQVVPSVDSKVCKKCAEEKRASDFPRNKLTSDGLHSYCKYAHFVDILFLAHRLSLP